MILKNLSFLKAGDKNLLCGDGCKYYVAEALGLVAGT